MTVLTKSQKEKLLQLIHGGERIEREAKVSWDGSNFLIRIPKEIADYLKIKKSDTVVFRIEDRNGAVTKSFDLGERRSGSHR